jgi:hypothetical protein
MKIYDEALYCQECSIQEAADGEAFEFYLAKTEHDYERLIPILGITEVAEQRELKALELAWNDLQAVPSYVEVQAQAWANELGLEIAE